MKTNIRVLALHNAYHKHQKKRSAVDQWRLARPMRELRKLCPEWTIDERPTVIPEIQKYKNAREFTEVELETAFADVCSYDIVFSSYQSNPTIYTLLQVAAKRAGTQYIMDVDDDMFSINRDNPVWLNLTDDNVDIMQRMIRNNAWLSTTTKTLAQVFRNRRIGHHKDSVFITPNFISDDYQHPPFDNGDKLVIGFFGGSSHYGDIHRTGVLEALERVMHEHKNVYFKSVGMIIDKYLPKARLIIGDAQRGEAWLKEIFPSLNMDIALGPLEDNLFNAGKSHIKWQEATRAGAMFIASNIGPYREVPPDAALLCRNTTDDWYRVLKQAVTDADLRAKTLKEAQRSLAGRYRLEDNVHLYKEMFETVHKMSTRTLQPA